MSKGKNIIRKFVMFMGVIQIIQIIIYGIFIYDSEYKVRTIDKIKSPNGEYKLILQSVGSPIFFSSADGRIKLKKGLKTICKEKIKVSNDGGSITDNSWKVTWKDDHVEIIISGEEQVDQLIVINYNGESESEELNTKYGEVADGKENTQEICTPELKGYRAIYDSNFKDKNYDFTEEYDAKGNLRVILYEDNSIVRYLVYDRESNNGKCGIYVYYESKKAEDGSWSVTNANIIDMYAYVYNSSDVVSSGKTHWDDTASSEYRNVTGE